jgi:hypothetical protein
MMSAMPTVSSLMRKPNVPAVAGSIRRRNVGPTNFPIARASPQPRARTRIPATIFSGVAKACTPQLPSRLQSLALRTGHARVRESTTCIATSTTMSRTSHTAAWRCARLTSFWLTSNDSPTFSQASLRVSNIRSRLSSLRRLNCLGMAP